jgi:hypothetical protein
VVQVRAQVVFQGASDLPEDVYVNTFHFVTPAGDSAVQRAAVAGRLKTFYEVAGTGSANSVGQFLSPYVRRPYLIKLYDMADLPPRQPLIDNTGVLPAPLTVTGLPEELACVLSFRGDPPLTARRRGRVYIGPLCLEAIDQSDAANPSLIDASLRFALRGAATDLAAAPEGWSVYSPTANQWTPVVDGWIDNAVDVQRRRGAAATVRSPWPA